MHKPGLVLLDEPTAGLDVRSSIAIRENLKLLAATEQVTIFLTTHNMEEAEKLCDQVAVINGGRLVAQGTPDELKKQVGNCAIEVVGRGFNALILDRIRSNSRVAGLELQDSHLVIDLVAETDPADFINILVSNGAQIEEVQRIEASLEEVFLKLTGEEND